MNTPRTFVDCILISLLATMLVFWPTVGDVRGQDASADKSSNGSIELNLLELLISPRIETTVASDLIWSIYPPPGYMGLVMIPLIVKPGDEDMPLDRGTLKLQGKRARFVAFLFPDLLTEQQMTGTGRGRRGSTAGRTNSSRTGLGGGGLPGGAGGRSAFGGGGMPGGLGGRSARGGGGMPGGLGGRSARGGGGGMPSGLGGRSALGGGGGGMPGGVGGRSAFGGGGGVGGRSAFGGGGGVGGRSAFGGGGGVGGRSAFGGGGFSGRRGSTAGRGGRRGASRGRGGRGGVSGSRGNLTELGDPYQGLRQPPRVATQVTVTPRGKIKWSLQRTIPGGVLNNSGQLYTMVVQPWRLSQLNPSSQRSGVGGGFGGGRGGSFGGGGGRGGSSRSGSRGGSYGGGRGSSSRSSGRGSSSRSSGRGSSSRSSGRGSSSRSSGRGSSSRSSGRGSSSRSGGRGGGGGGRGGSFGGGGGRGGSFGGGGGRGGSFGGGGGRGGSFGGGGGRGGSFGGGGGRGGSFGGQNADSQQIAAAQYKYSREQYRKLQQEVQSLKTDFEAPLPKRIWAIFQLDMGEQELNIQSSAYPALNWQVSFDRLAMLRAAASQSLVPTYDFEDKAVFSAAQQGLLNELGQLAKDPNPHSSRAVAHVLRQSRAATNVEMGSPLFLLYQTILNGDDVEARRITQLELNTTDAQTRAGEQAKDALQRLAMARSRNDADTRMNVDTFKDRLALGIRRMTTDLNAEVEVLAIINQELADPKGTPPGDVLTAAIEEVRAYEYDYPEIVFALADGIRFRSMSEVRIQQALVAIVEHAGTDQLAERWLDEQFLSSANPDMVQRCLEVIVEADTGTKSVGWMIDWAVVKMLGSAPKTDLLKLNAKGVSKIPIHSVQHGLIRSLRSGDTKIRELAWQALPHFKMPPQAVGFDGQEEAELAQNDRYTVVVNAALDQQPTPTQVVDFLAAQPALIVSAAADLNNNPNRALSRGRGGTRPGARRASRSSFGGGGGFPGAAGMGGIGMGIAGGRPNIAGGGAGRAAARPRGAARGRTTRSTRGRGGGRATGRPTLGGGMGFPGAASRGVTRPGRRTRARSLGTRRFRGGVDATEHPDILKAVSSLVLIVSRGSLAASTAAARALRGSSDWPLEEALMELEFGDREGFARQTYAAFPSFDPRSIVQTVPLVTAVMREKAERNPVVEWFGQQLSNDTLPAPSQWINAFPGGEDEVLGLVTANDRELGNGAVAVLVASAGGDDRMALSFADELRALKNPSEDDLRKAWDKKRRELFLEQMGRAQGMYRLVLKIGPTDADATARSRAAASSTPRLGRRRSSNRGMPPTAASGGPGAGFMAGGLPPAALAGFGNPNLAGAQARKPADKPKVVYVSEIVLGVIELRVSSKGISFGNEKLPSVSVHKTKAAISIDKPSEFKNWVDTLRDRGDLVDAEELENLELEDVNYAVELTLQPSGLWQGACNTAPPTSSRGARSRTGVRSRSNPAVGVYVFLEPQERSADEE